MKYIHVFSFFCCVLLSLNLKSNKELIYTKYILWTQTHSTRTLTRQSTVFSVACKYYTSILHMYHQINDDIYESQQCKVAVQQCIAVRWLCDHIINFDSLNARYDMRWGRDSGLAFVAKFNFRWIHISERAGHSNFAINPGKSE